MRKELIKSFSIGLAFIAGALLYLLIPFRGISWIHFFYILVPLMVALVVARLLETGTRKTLVGVIFSLIICLLLGFVLGKKSVTFKVKRDIYQAYQDSMDTEYLNFSPDGTEMIKEYGRCFPGESEKYLLKYYP